MKKYAALVFETEPEAIDTVIEKIREISSINIIFFKTSYDKIWITTEPTPKEKNNYE